MNEKLEFWWYYAENGTALFLRFFDGELGEARYERPEYGVSGRCVQSIDRELNGRNIFSIMAQRSWQKGPGHSRDSLPVPAGALMPSARNRYGGGRRGSLPPGTFRGNCWTVSESE